MMREFTPVELAYAAGMMEGEGTIAINRFTKRNLGHLVVSMVNTDYEVIAFFRIRWGGYYRYQELPGNRRPAHRWQLAARQAAEFLETVLPYLRTQRMREKADLGLAFQAQKTLHRRNRLPEYHDSQRAMWEAMRELNKRGAASG